MGSSKYLLAVAMYCSFYLRRLRLKFPSTKIWNVRFVPVRVRRPVLWRVRGIEWPNGRKSDSVSACGKEEEREEKTARRRRFPRKREMPRNVSRNGPLSLRAKILVG